MADLAAARIGHGLQRRAGLHQAGAEPAIGAGVGPEPVAGAQDQHLDALVGRRAQAGLHADADLALAGDGALGRVLADQGERIGAVVVDRAGEEDARARGMGGGDGVLQHRQGQAGPVAIAGRVHAVDDELGSLGRGDHLGPVHRVAAHPFAHPRSGGRACPGCGSGRGRSSRGRPGRGPSLRRRRRWRRGPVQSSVGSCRLSLLTRRCGAASINEIVEIRGSDIHLRMTPDSISWELYRSFLAVARHGSLSGAARALRLTQPTLGRHIDQLEQALGAPMFTRSPQGLLPTDLALTLVPIAEAMESAAAAMTRAASGAAGEVAGVVRVTASEIVGRRGAARHTGRVLRPAPRRRLRAEPVQPDRGPAAPRRRYRRSHGAPDPGGPGRPAAGRDGDRLLRPSPLSGRPHDPPDPWRTWTATA